MTIVSMRANRHVRTRRTEQIEFAAPTGLAPRGAEARVVEPLVGPAVELVVAAVVVVPLVVERLVHPAAVLVVVRPAAVEISAMTAAATPAETIAHSNRCSAIRVRIAARGIARLVRWDAVVTRLWASVSPPAQRPAIVPRSAISPPVAMGSVFQTKARRKQRPRGGRPGKSAKCSSACGFRPLGPLCKPILRRCHA